MDKKENGSNFYQLTAQVLNDPNLSSSEKICMSILYGLSDEEGKCYPSNMWLAKKLSMSERGIQKILEKLEKNNYLFRQIVTHQNNLMKKYRIIYVTNNFKFNLDNTKKINRDELEFALEDELEFAHDTNSSSCIIDKKDIIDKKERERGASPPPPPPHPIFYQIHKRVKIRSDKYDALNVEFGGEKVLEMMDRLDEYADLNPKRFKQYACHAAVIRKWIREDKLKTPSKTSRDFLESIKRHPQVQILALKNEVEIYSTGIVFPRIRDANFNVNEPGFEQKVINTLRKMNVHID